MGQGLAVAIARRAGGRGAGRVSLTGIGVGVFRVHPLIMTLGMGLVVLGLANVWQLSMVQTGAGVPPMLRSLGSGHGSSAILPNSLLVFVPLAAVILLGLRRTGYGRLLYAIGDNPIAARLSGARSWQVLVVLYIISALLAAVAGFLISGLDQRRQRDARRQLRAALGGGGGHRRDLDPGRSRRLRRHDRRRADPDRLTSLLSVARASRGGPPGPVRGDHRRRRGGLHPGDRRDLTGASEPASTVPATSGSTSAARTSSGPCVERDGEAGTTLDRDQVATPIGTTATAARSSTGWSRSRRRRRSARWPGVATRRHRRARAVRPGGRHDAVPGQPPGRAGRASRSPGPVGDALGVPAALINDARAFGLAELRLGAGRGASSMVGLTLGTGVGGVIAVDGRVHQGHDGTAGEIGHQTIEPDGPWCGCGNRGCLEAFARADQIAGGVRHGHGRGGGRAGPGRRRRGRCAGWPRSGRYLGIGIANMITVITPDRVVIGGGVSAAGDLLLGPIRDELRRRVRTTSLEEVEIVTAELGTWAGAIGAAIHGAEAMERAEAGNGALDQSRHRRARGAR